MDKECIFCKIAAGQIPSETVYEDEHVKAFNDIHPLAPAHVVIIPKKHIATLNDVKKADEDILRRLMLAAAEVARLKNIAEPGYRVVFNVNPEGGQVIFHMHLHVLGGRKMKDPPG